jgi:predicted metalloprotease with PDZ domain
MKSALLSTRTPLRRWTRWSVPAALSLLLSAAVSSVASAQQPALLSVDATEATRNILHVRMVIPARPGPFALVYPKWIPGDHSPSGPIAGMVGLKISAGDRPVAWQRDDTDIFTFHCEVPEGAHAVDVAFDFVRPPGQTASAQLARIDWNRVLLYPAGEKSDAYLVKAGLLLPEGWKLGTALPVESASGNRTEFQAASLTTLVDSPVLAGRYLQIVPLSTGETPSHEIDLASDDPTTMPPEMIARYKQLVAEAWALFGARHYRSYRWLLSLSNYAGFAGLEHHESSEDGVRANGFTDAFGRYELADLLAHEYVHSWNGKYRRPAGLATPDFQTPMKTELLWVYEGMTQYLGTILPPRSGLWTPEEFRESLACIAAAMDHTSGRRWRPLADTAVGLQAYTPSSTTWMLERRSGDYYSESVLIWLEADVLIRQKTGGKKSLDDFCRLFAGGRSGPPTVQTYTFENIVSTLNEVCPSDWAGFLRERIYTVRPQAPLGGIEGSGWKLVYNQTPNPYDRHYVRFTGTDNLFSIGLLTDETGMVSDIATGMAADRAGISPGMKLIAINGRTWSPENLNEAIQATREGKALEILIENSGFVKTIHLDYRDGLRYPHLVRDDSRPDLLTPIIRSRTNR